MLYHIPVSILLKHLLLLYTIKKIRKKKTKKNLFSFNGIIIAMDFHGYKNRQNNHKNNIKTTIKFSQSRFVIKTE